ncbi:hypothetical protein ACEWY4_004073 [Coilia grayii]|uniref:TATA box-binding protein-associated factor RNA polymerase I subunit C n=1 Tax=Coilia grayii TaxID=363190 RepID=A0ABD1KKQ1_9TELE
MDNDFPCQLFTCFFNDGPPCHRRSGNIGGRKSHNNVLGWDSGQSIEWVAQNQVKGEHWLPTQPIVAPLLPPNKTDVYSSSPHIKTDPADFTQHMQNFYLDHYKHAFQTMSHLLSESSTHGQTSYSRQWRRRFLNRLKYTMCPVTSTRTRAQRYDSFFEDAIHDIPPALLAELLQEDLAFQRGQEKYQELDTGGALGCVSFSESSDFQDGCLIYPSNQGLQTLNFHRVALKSNSHDVPQLETVGSPTTYNLNGSIRQVSTGTLQETVHVGVRSDHFCGAWIVGDSVKPRALGVIQTQQPATCLVVSPHISEELLVASESGAVCLWTVGKGLTKVREEDSNLYFNANSAWRWCEFSAHPRVMIYADRTGADLTDFRTGDHNSYTLFRIGKVSESKSGERLILSQYLSEVHAHHHLVATQYSAYIMDERMPSVPMLKWEHGMKRPPMFAHALAGTSPERSHRVLLGSQNTQELMMMQYSGGCFRPCMAQGAHQKLLCPSETLAHLPLRLPHRKQAAQDRLSLPAAGLTAMQTSQHVCVLQLSSAGDLFYQTLQLCSEGPAEKSTQPPTSSGNGQEVDGSRPPSSVDSSVDDDDDDDDRARLRRPPPGGLEVVVNSPELFDPSDIESEGGQGYAESSQPVGRSSCPTTALADVLQPHQEVLRAWNEWLVALDSEENIKHSNSPFTHCVKLVKELSIYVLPQRDPHIECAIQSVRQALRKATRTGEVLTHSATRLPPLRVTPAPGATEPSKWTDELSERLSETWRGRWRQWWDDRLGLNHEQKREALRKKRRQEKSKRRRRISLSGSFTSSVSYQSDSELSAWSECNSQDLGSDWEEEVAAPPGSKDGALSPEIPTTSDIGLGKPLFQSTQSTEREALVPATEARKASIPADPSASPPLLLAAESSQASVAPSLPQKRLGRTEQGTLHSLSQKRPQRTEQNSLDPLPQKRLGRTEQNTQDPLPQKRPRRTEQDILDSLFSSQEPSQSLLEQSSIPMVTPSSQLSSFSSSQRPPQVRASHSQASQSQAKKRARMGF